MADGSVAVVLGTRPEAIKLFILVELLGAACELIHTGQHFDASLADGVADDLHLRRPDVQLRLGGIARGAQIGRITDALSNRFAAERPAVVIVQGDTNSALAGALAANAVEVPLIHVEAGLRSRDRAMPEEHNRVMIDHLADVCAAPTGDAAANLAAEGITGSRVALTGNTIVEAVHRMLPAPVERRRIRKELQLDGPFVLATIHRPENVDDETSLRSVLDALVGLPMPVVLPLHPRTAARAASFRLTPLLDQLRIAPPMPPAAFLGLAAEASLLVSDSGGVQEEASILKRRVLVLRRSTERPEALGTFSELVTADRLGHRAEQLLAPGGKLADLHGVPSPFGDGTASTKIADIARSIAGQLSPAGRNWST